VLRFVSEPSTPKGEVQVAKYADFLPLYRQAGIFARQGMELDRSTLCDWVGRACWWLEPLWRLLRRHVMGSTRIFADDTPLPVLDPGRGRTKTGRLWGYAIDDRPWGGETPPAVVYLYAEDRKGEHPAAHLAEFQGVLQVDGYGGSMGLLEPRNRGPRPPRRGSSPASASTARASVPAAPAGALRLSP
jgi:transposase